MDEEALISELDEILNSHRDPSEPLPLNIINLLQDLLDSSQHGAATQNFLSSSSILPPLTSGMDAGSNDVSIHSSSAFLSLHLVCPSYITKFSPVPFLSLLRSLRRSIKSQPGTAGFDNDDSSSRNAKKRNGKRRVSSPSTTVVDTGVYLSVLDKLERVLELIDLTRFPDVLKPLVQTIAAVPRAAGHAFSNASEYNKLKTICSNVLLRVMSCGGERESAETAVDVFKELAPMMFASGKSPERAFALNFLHVLIDGNAFGNREGTQRALVNFPVYLARKAPEKADGRSLAVDAITEVVKTMSIEDRAAFATFSIQLTTGKGNLRILGVDLVYNMIISDARETIGFEVCKGCVNALIHRCSDISANVRARALSNLTNLVGQMNHFEVSMDELRKVLQSCCADEKANVRRAALGFVGKLISTLGEGILDDTLVKTLGMACSDPLVSIRKASVQALSDAFKNFSEKSVTIEWLNSVPRLINDNETGIQEECESLFLELVLDRIANVGSSESLQTETPITRSTKKRKLSDQVIDTAAVESVFVLLEGLCNGEVAPWVKKICSSLGKKKKLKKKVATSLQNLIKASESHWLRSSKPISKWTSPPGAWFLLSETSAYLSKSVDWDFLHHNWVILDQHKNPSDSNPQDEKSLSWAGDRVFLLQTISNVSVELPPDSAADLAHDLLRKIEKFDMHTSEVNAHVKALKVLCKRKSVTSDEADRLVKKWVQQVLTKAAKIVERCVSDNPDNEGSSFTTPVRSKSSSKAETAIYTVGSIVILCPSADTSRIVPLLHSIITSVHSDAKLRKIPGPAITTKHNSLALYTQAWLTMGKICLFDGKLAKSYIPLFVRELEKSDNSALRNNLVVMMSDFCVRHTSLVDCHISKITKCLRDPCELVRRQTFILLSRLLQRDYVKWRGVLFLRFLLCLVDESDRIKELAEFLFENIVKVKAPLLAYNSFIEAIYVLNDCDARTGQTSKSDNRLFSLSGNDDVSRGKRMHVYSSLLKQMAPEHLLATFAKLCAEILAAASDGILKLNDVAAQSVLQDAFRVLSCKEMRINASRPPPVDSDAEEDGVASSAVKEKAISQAVRKSVIQNTIPIFIELKRILESKNSHLIGSLMECLRVLLKDFKHEIAEILVADQQLRKELLYDMQKYESSRAASARKNSAAAKARTVLEDVRNGVSTPPLSSLGVPKLKTGTAPRDAKVLESVRRQCFINDVDE